MPVPRPGKDESQGDFMARCMKMMHGENDSKPDNMKRPQKQMVAICISQWKEGKAENETPADNVESEAEFIKNFIEKYPQYKEYFEEKND